MLIKNAVVLDDRFQLSKKDILTDGDSIQAVGVGLSAEGQEVLDASEEGSRVQITITEGKFHQIKRMVKAVGSEVLYLKRLTIGPLRLDDTLPSGSYRKLTEEEIRRLKEKKC